MLATNAFYISCLRAMIVIALLYKTKIFRIISVHIIKKNISSLTAGLKRFEICSSGTELNWT